MIERSDEAWKEVFHRGIVPQLPTKGLLALRKALMEDDPRLCQGATTSPPPLQCVQDWDVEAACFIGFCGWQAEDDPSEATVADVEEFFARVCFECDQVLGEPAAVRWFLNWADETPRVEVRRSLLPEVELALTQREGMVARG